MKVALDFNNIKDTDLILKFRTIVSGMKANIGLFPDLPENLDDFLALVDQYDQATIASQDSKKAISLRQKLRFQASKKATYIGHYVEHVSGDDLGIVYAAGFEPAYKYRLLPQSLPKTGIAKVIRGPNSGTAWVYLIPISRAKYGRVAYYEFQYAAKKGNEIGEFIALTSSVARFPILIKGLVPGTVYILQARVRNSVGVTDWSEPVDYMAT